MDRTELIQRIKESASLYNQGRTYEALQLIYPVHSMVRHEKVQKLYTVSRQKALTNIKHLMEEKRFSRIIELHNEFLSEMNDPDFQALVDEAKRKIVFLKKEPIELSVEDIDPALEDPITEIISDSWIASDAENETQSHDMASETAAREPITEEAPPEPFAEPDEVDLNDLIQRGVSLYEVGDVENALRIWRKGLEVDPENVILKEYVGNAMREIEDEDSDQPEHEPTIEAPPSPELDVLDRDELNRLVAMARAGDVERAQHALDKLAEKSGLTPEIEEAKKFIATLAVTYGVSSLIAKVDQLLNEHRASDAVSLLEAHLVQHPEHIELKDVLEKARRQMIDEPTNSFSASIELDYGEEDVTSGNGTPQPPIPRERQKPVQPLRPTDTKKMSRNTIVAGIIVTASIVVLGILAYFLVPQIQLQRFYQNFKQQQLSKTKQATPVKSALSQTSDREYQALVSRAKQYYNQRKYLFAYYLLLHAESIRPLGDGDRQFLTAARNEMIRPIDARQVKREADRALAKQNYEVATEGYYHLLSSNPDSIEYKKKLTDVYEQAGIANAYNGKGVVAKEYFDYAQILDPINPILKNHEEVVSRLISGRISRHQAQEWFFFFR